MFSASGLLVAPCLRIFIYYESSKNKDTACCYDDDLDMCQLYPKHLGLDEFKVIASKKTLTQTYLNSNYLVIQGGF